MGAVEQFTRRGIRLELADGENLRAIGKINDSMRTAIRIQKAQIVGELQLREFESLLAIVAPAHNTPAHELNEIRMTARADLSAAICSYRAMARYIKPIVRIGDEKNSSGRAI